MDLCKALKRGYKDSQEACNVPGLVDDSGQLASLSLFYYSSWLLQKSVRVQHIAAFPQARFIRHEIGGLWP